MIKLTNKCSFCLSISWGRVPVGGRQRGLRTSIQMVTVSLLLMQCNAVNIAIIVSDKQATKRKDASPLAVEVPTLLHITECHFKDLNNKDLICIFITTDPILHITNWTLLSRCLWSFFYLTDEFIGFDTKVLQLRSLLLMKGSLGRTRNYQAMVCVLSNVLI